MKPNYDLEKFNKLVEKEEDVKNIIAPEYIEVDFNHLQIDDDNYYRTLFVSGYPRFVSANWLSPIINFDSSLDIAFFHYPVASSGILQDLRRKLAELEATIKADLERGRIVDPKVQAALEDARELQEELTKGSERFFRFNFYITIPANNKKELDRVTEQVLGTLGSLMINAKKATLQMEQGFKSTLPVCYDHLNVPRNMDTTSLSTTFPFVSSELTANEGILYGINQHNKTLIIFDRFSLENYNSVVFGKAGSGKSYLSKLEVMRSLMFGSEVIIIDPEQEYRALAEELDGEYISFSMDSPSKLNPFDLADVAEEGENQLGNKILSLHHLFRIMLGDLTSHEEAVLDRALMTTYKAKGITPDPETQLDKEPPLMEDLYKNLLGMEEKSAQSLAERMERYIKGSLAGIFDQRTTVDITNKLTVFSTRNLEDKLRPVAMYIILDYVWNKIKGDLKKRLLVVDEAWYLMRHKDSAEFLYSIAKRARKYYLGLNTITQDVDDFLNSEYGKAIIDNSSLAMLMKQHPAAIDLVEETFYLSEGEKRRLLGASIGEGLFFAGSNHVAMKVVASDEEHELITTKPEELLKRKKERGKEPKKKSPTQAASKEKPELESKNKKDTTKKPPNSKNKKEIRNQTKNKKTNNGKERVYKGG